MSDALLETAQVSALHEKQDWLALVKRIDRQVERKKAKIVSTVLGDSGLSSEAGQYLRGYVQALEWVKDQPRVATVEYNTGKAREGK